MGSILSFSFFITRQMRVDLRAGELSGTLPILYVFLARSGKTIREVSPVALDDKGAAYFANENPGRNATRGVRIVFAGSDGEARTLYYFSTDLSNGGVRVSGFLKFCETLAPGNSLIKSASYLLHSGNFTTVRDFLLRNSATIIQDDSGIPLAYYNPRRNGASSRSAVMPVRSPNFLEDIRRNMPSYSGGRSRWISASAIAGDRMNRTCCCRSSCPPMIQAVLTRRHRHRRPSPRRPNHHVPGRRVRRPRSGSPEVSGFHADAFRTKALAALDGKCLNQRSHHRTLWLGTIKVLVFGLSVSPLKNRQAARITMKSASAASRST